MQMNSLFKFVPAFLFAFACSFGLVACGDDSSTGGGSSEESFNIDDGDFVIGGDSDPLDFIDWGDDESSSSSKVKNSSSSAKSSSSSAKSSCSSAKSSSSSAKNSSSSAKSSSSSVKSSSSTAKSSSAKNSSSSAKSSSSADESSSSEIVDDTESWEISIVMNETFDDYLNWTLDYTLSTTIVVKADTNYSMLNGATVSNYTAEQTSFKSDKIERRIVSHRKNSVKNTGSLLAYEDEKSSEIILELSFPDLPNGLLNFTKTDKIYDAETGKKIVRDDNGTYIIDMPVFTLKLKEGTFDITYIAGDEDVAPEDRTDFMAQNKTTVANFRAADEDLELYPTNVDDGLPVMRFTQSGSGTITIKRLE